MSGVYLRANGIQTGPHDADAVAREFHSGNLAAETMSWCTGEMRWISLGRRWSTQRASAWRMIAGVVLALLGASGAVVLVRTRLRFLPFHLQTASLLWSAVVVLIGLAACGLMVAWREPRRAKLASLWLVLPTVAVVVACIWSFAGAGFDARVLRLRQVAANANVSFDGAHAGIRIEGFLGPRLPDQVHAALAAHPDVRMLVLDSPGGLMEGAIRTAKLVHARGLTTRVDGMCASACVAIWAAGVHHQMAATSRIGIHRAFLPFDTPAAVARNATRHLTARYDHFLHGAGFDPQVIHKGNETPSRDMYWLNPLQVSAAGVDVTIVDADGVVVPPAMARWLWVAGLHGSGDPIGRLLLAIAKHQPRVALRHAYALYAAEVEDNDAPAVRAAMNDLYLDAKRAALVRASDAQTVAWARGMLAEYGGWRYAQSCAVKTGSRDLHRRAVQVLDRLIEGIGADAIARATLPRYDAADRRVLRQALADTRDHGGAADTTRWRPVDWCTYRLSYLGHALQLPQHQAADAVRLLELDPGRLH